MKNKNITKTKIISNKGKILKRIIKTWKRYIKEEKKKKEIGLLIKYMEEVRKKKEEKRIRKRICIITERGRSVYRLTMMSRIKTREYGSNGYFIGIRKANW